MVALLRKRKLVIYRQLQRWAGSRNRFAGADGAAAVIDVHDVNTAGGCISREQRAGRLCPLQLEGDAGVGSTHCDRRSIRREHSNRPRY